MGTLRVRPVLWGTGRVPGLRAAGGKRSPERCLLQQQVCTAGENPSRNLLLGCAGLSTLQEMLCDTAHDQTPEQGAGAFAFCSGENFSALPLPLLKSTNHSIY